MLLCKGESVNPHIERYQSPHKKLKSFEQKRNKRLIVDNMWNKKDLEAHVKTLVDKTYTGTIFNYIQYTIALTYMHIYSVLQTHNAIH